MVRLTLGRTLHSPTHFHGLQMESMGSPQGLHFHFCHYSKSPCGLYAESMKTPHGVHMDFAKFMDSMKTCDQVSCGLLWTPSEVHGLSVDSLRNPWTPPTYYLNSLNNLKKMVMPRLEPSTFCYQTQQHTYQLYQLATPFQDTACYT